MPQPAAGWRTVPSSNMRLASGIAPLWECMQHGVKVGLGVDGSASNDSSHLLAEVRQAMLLARLRAGLEGASLSGGRRAAPDDRPPGARAWPPAAAQPCWGATDIGSLEAGKCADFFAINLNRLDYAGALHDPVAALVFCAPQQVDYTVVHGKLVVKDGQLLHGRCSCPGRAT